MRLLISRTFAIGLYGVDQPDILEDGCLLILSNRSIQQFNDLIGEDLLIPDRLADLWMDRTHELKQSGLKVPDLIQGYIIGKVIGHCIDADNLLVQGSEAPPHRLADPPQNRRDIDA